MDDLQLICDYKDNDNYRKSFIELAQQVFGIDFSEFYTRGLWQEQYKCYSFLEKDKVIANASINLFPLFIEDRTYRALQIGTVMTLPEYRNMGLSRRLIENIFADYNDKIDIFYLFANNSVKDFYPRFGFSKIPQYLFACDLKDCSEHTRLEKIDINDPIQYETLKRVVQNRVLNSKQYDFKDCSYLNLFHLNFVYDDCIYYVREYDTILVFRKNDGHIDLFDYITTEINDVMEILNKTFSSDTDKVVLHFTPYLNTNDFRKKDYNDPDDLFFVRGDISIPDIFHPALAKA